MKSRLGMPLISALAEISQSSLAASHLIKEHNYVELTRLKNRFDQMYLFASTGDKQLQFRPDSWVPTETVIAKRNREQRPFVKFAQLCIRIQQEEGSNEFDVILASCSGKGQRQKERRSSTSKVRVKETEMENFSLHRESNPGALSP